MRGWSRWCPDAEGDDYLAFLQTRDQWICAVKDLLTDPLFWVVFAIRFAVFAAVATIALVAAGVWP